MFLGACIQAGVPENFLRKELEKLNLPQEYQMEISDEVKNGIGAVYVDVKLLKNFSPEKINSEPNIRRLHRLEHAGHVHRTFADIREIIEKSDLSDKVKETALKIFSVIATAEGKVHLRSPETVTFHEVGAVDSIVDIVGCAICLDYLEVEKIFVSKINVGGGFVKCAHGLMPVPAPATAELLQGFKTFSFGAERELTTPTGAAIVNALAEYSRDLPENFSSEKIGYGAGTLNLDIPNVLRIYCGEIEGQKKRRILKLETNIDDMNPQIFGYLYDKLFAAGALDVWTTGIYMKKNRPAQMLSVLTDEDKRDDCIKIIFEETTTIGMRIINIDERLEASRKSAKVLTEYGEVRCKVSAYGGKIVSITPETCRRKKCSSESRLAGRFDETKRAARLKKFSLSYEKNLSRK